MSLEEGSAKSIFPTCGVSMNYSMAELASNSLGYKQLFDEKKAHGLRCRNDPDRMRKVIQEHYISEHSCRPFRSKRVYSLFPEKSKKRKI